MPATLQEALQAICQPGACSRVAGEKFIQEFPLPVILEALNEGSVKAQLVVEALDKLLDAGISVAYAEQHALAALDSASPEFRNLANRLLGRKILEGHTEDQEGRVLTAHLLSSLADSDTTVASGAWRALQLVAATPKGIEYILGAGAVQIQELTTLSDLTVRLRAFSLITSLAAVSPEGAAQVRQQGLLEPLGEEIGNVQDPLGCAAALNLVIQLVQQSGPAANTLLGPNVLPKLSHVMQQHDAFLQSQSLQALGAFLTASTQAGSDDHKITSIRGQPLRTYVLELLQDLLAEGTEAEEALQIAALDVVGQISSSKNGAEMLASETTLPQLVGQKAFDSSGASVHVPAMLSLAHLLGVARAGEELSSSGAMLSQRAEQQVNDAMFPALGRSSLAEVLWKRLKQPFEDARRATYELLLGIAFRPWGAREVCCHDPLLDYLCNPKSEVTHEACHFRFNVVQVLQRTAVGTLRDSGWRQQDPLAAVYPRLEQAAKQGAFGTGISRPPIVGTDLG